jgi:hypothetical protein
MGEMNSYQTMWFKKLNLSTERLKTCRRAGVSDLPNIIQSSCTNDQSLRFRPEFSVK